MFGCYRAGDANDPQIYTAAITAVLADYPADVVIAVTDPRSGIPRRLTFLPAVAEVAAACDAEVERRRAAAHLAQLRRRAPPPPVAEVERTPEHDARMRERFAQLLADLGRGRLARLESDTQAPEIGEPSRSGFTGAEA